MSSSKNQAKISIPAHSVRGSEQKSEKIMEVLNLHSIYLLITDKPDLEMLGISEPSLEILGTRSNPARSDNAKKMH